MKGVLLLCMAIMAAAQPQSPCILSGQGPGVGYTLTAINGGNGCQWQNTGLSIEAFGASPTAPASANTAAIQNALNQGGFLSLSTPGTYSINNTLVINSNTWLRLGSGVIIQEAAATNKNMLENAGYNTFSTTASVTLTWSAGINFSVAWTSHGLNVGDYVLLAGSSPSMFNGVFQVISVTDANDFTVNAMRLPSASPTGAATGKKCDANITIEGGTWDYNSQAGPSGTNAHAIILGAVGNLTVRNLIVKNAIKYDLNIGAARDVVVDNVDFPVTNSDMIKIQGPMAHLRIHQVSGKNGDDCISLETKTASGFSQYMWTFGDVQDAEVDGLNCQGNGGSGQFVLYPSANEYMGGVTVRNIGGSGEPTVAISPSWASSVIDNVVFEHITGNGGPVIYIGSGSNTETINSLTFRDVVFNAPTVSQAQLFLIDPNTTTHFLSVDGLSLASTVWPNTTLYLMQINGTHDLIRVKNGYFSGANTPRFMQVNSGTVSQLILDNINGATGDTLLNIGTSNTVGSVLIQGCNWTGGTSAAFISQGTSTSVTFLGNRFANMSNGVIRTTGTPTLHIYGTGNTLASGAWLAVPSGTPVLNFHSWDFQVDLSTTGVNKAIGDYVYNTNSALGTLGTTGFVVADAAEWYLLKNTTLKYP